MGFMSDATTREQDAETFFQNTPRLYVTSAITDPHGTWSDRILGNNSSLMPVWAEQSRSLVTTPSGDLRFRRRDRVSGAALGGIWRRLYPRRECVVNSKLLRVGDGRRSVLLMWCSRVRDRPPAAGPRATPPAGGRGRSARTWNGRTRYRFQGWAIRTRMVWTGVWAGSWAIGGLLRWSRLVGHSGGSPRALEGHAVGEGVAVGQVHGERRDGRPRGP